MSEPKPDIVDQALAKLMASSSTGKIPAEVISRLEQQIQNRQITKAREKIQSSSRQTQVAWFPLTSCLLIMMLASGIAGYHKTLFRTTAGQCLTGDGQLQVYYSDGQVFVQTK